jgi:toxin CptA
VYFPIYIELHRSRLLLFLLLLFHALASGCVVVLPCSWGLRFVLLGLIGISMLRVLRPPDVVGLRLSESGELDCIFASGDRVACEILPDSTVFNWLVVLRYKLGEHSRPGSLALPTDSMSAGQFRVLRLWLRWRSATSEHARLSV